MHHALNTGASSDPTLAISDHWRELKALQTHSNLRGIDWRASKCTCTSIAFLHVLPAPSRGVLRQPLQHLLCGHHLTFSLCLSYHSAATTSEHARNANDIKILSRKRPHIQTPQYVKALLLSASETTIVIACKLQTMCTWVESTWKRFEKVDTEQYHSSRGETEPGEAEARSRVWTSERRDRRDGLRGVKLSDVIEILPLSKINPCQCLIYVLIIHRAAALHNHRWAGLCENPWESLSCQFDLQLSLKLSSWSWNYHPVRLVSAFHAQYQQFFFLDVYFLF